MRKLIANMNTYLTSQTCNMVNDDRDKIELSFTLKVLGTSTESPRVYTLRDITNNISLYCAFTTSQKSSYNAIVNVIKKYETELYRKGINSDVLRHVVIKYLKPKGYYVIIDNNHPPTLNDVLRIYK